MYKTIKLLPNAYALRPVRFYSNKPVARYYTATTFPQDPYGGCLLTLRRCKVFGGIDDTYKGDLLVDVLDKNFDIIQDFSVNKKGFEYLRRVLKFKVTNETVKNGNTSR